MITSIMKVCVKKSNNGNGLFCTENINKGEIVCILPIDYYKRKNDSKWYTIEEINKGPINLRYAIKCGNFIGVSNHNRIENEFIGHMINDYIDMSLVNKNKYEILSSIHENVEVEDSINKYNNRLGLKVISKRNIKKDEEIFFSYGVEYWKEYSSNKNYEITTVVEYLKK